MFNWWTCVIFVPCIWRIRCHSNILKDTKEDIWKNRAKRQKTCSYLAGDRFSKNISNFHRCFKQNRNKACHGHQFCNCAIFKQRIIPPFKLNYFFIESKLLYISEYNNKQSIYITIIYTIFFGPSMHVRMKQIKIITKSCDRV